VDGIRQNRWVVGPICCIGLWAICPAWCVAQQGFSALPGQTAGPSSATQSMAASVMKGFDKLTGAIAPKPTVKKAVYPISLQTKSNPGPELYVRVARLAEQTGKPAEAAKNYRKALEIRPNYLGALLGYARLKDRTGDVPGAGRLYRQAAKTHPKEAAVFNNLGLFQVRHRMFDVAANSLTQAIRLQPRNVKYRNNLATLLVEQAKYKEAFMHLQVVHGEAVAYYNLGFLLEKKGELQPAVLHYAVAARKNPALVEAGQALARLQSVARRPQASPVRPPGPAPNKRATGPVGTRPPMHQGYPLRPPTQSPTLPLRRSPVLPPAPDRPGPSVRQLPPAPSEQEQFGRRPPIRSLPERLPPTSTRAPGDSDVAPLPQGAYRPPPVSSAPLPPPYRPGSTFSPLPGR